MQTSNSPYSPLSRGGHFVSGDLKGFVYAPYSLVLSTRPGLHNQSFLNLLRQNGRRVTMANCSYTWKRGLSWPCFDTTLPALLCKSCCSYATWYFLAKFTFHLKREEVCIKTRSTSASRTNRSFKQPRFWLTHVNRKWAVFSFNMRWRYQICIVRCLYLYRNDLPQNVLKKSTSGWHASLKDVAT